MMQLPKFTRKHFLIFCLLITSGENHAIQNDSIIKKLDNSIRLKDSYVKKKHRKNAF